MIPHLTEKVKCALKLFVITSLFLFGTYDLFGHFVSQIGLNSKVYRSLAELSDQLFLFK